MGTKAVGKALTLLRCFDAATPEWRVSELSRETGLDKSHISKILHELTAHGFLLRDPSSKSYRVGPRAMVVGAGYLAGDPMGRIGAPVIRDLSSETGFTATLNIIHGSSIIFAAISKRAGGAQPSRSVGALLPTHATAAGKIHAAYASSDLAAQLLKGEKLPPVTCLSIRDPNILAHQLDQVRKSGLACAKGESTVGVGSIAVPVFDDDTEIVGAISLLFRLQGKESPRTEALRALRQAARHIGRRISEDRVKQSVFAPASGVAVCADRLVNFAEPPRTWAR
jgi:DNA-binding IclR family transcriptional regulator